MGRGSLPVTSLKPARQPARACSSDSGRCAAHAPLRPPSPPFSISSVSFPVQILFSRLAQQQQSTVPSPLRNIQREGEPRDGRLRDCLPFLPGELV